MHDITYFQFTILFSHESLYTFIVNSRYLLFQNTIQNTLNSRYITFYTHDITNHIKKINVKCNTEKKLQLKQPPPKKNQQKQHITIVPKWDTKKTKKELGQEVCSKYYQHHWRVIKEQ